MLALLMLFVLVSAAGTLSAKSDPVIVPNLRDDLTASFGVNEAPQSFLKGQGKGALDLRDTAWTLKGSQAGVGNNYLSGRSWSAQESGISQPNLIYADTRQFDYATGSGDFASADEGSVELVIGINNTGQHNYYELMDRLTENGGKFVDSVLIGDNTRAMVADLPLSSLNSFRSQTERDGLASYIEPNLRYGIDAVPNDPDWSKQWGPQMIEADWAWNTTVGDRSILVAVVDTGIDWHHPDLTANYVALGYDWVNNDPYPMDDNGHGTHVAGVIAAAINNSFGMAGLAQVHIMAEKALDESGRGTSSELAKAIIHAVHQGAKIISCSWGAYADSTVLHEAMKYAFENGVLVVAAAGNDATNAKHYPAAYDEVVAVAATDELDNPASFTNYGDWVKVAAPGVHIYSTFLDGTYAYLSGTSMATPHVSGVAALIWSRFPNMTREQVRAQLQFSSDDLGETGFDVHYGYGRINARKAVEQTPRDHDVLVLDLNTPSYLRPGDAAVLNATMLNMGESNESAITVQWLVNGIVIHSQNIDFLMSGSSAYLNCVWTPVAHGACNVTCYVLPLSEEAVVSNNFLSATVMVRTPQFIRVPNDYSKIQDAIDAAFEGDTIYVASGTYHENVRIDKEGLTLIGEDQGNTIVDGQNKEDVILVTANKVNISGFTLQNSLRSLGYAGIFVVSEGVSITNTTTVGNYHGILLYDAVNAILRNNNVTGNNYNFGVEGYTVTDFTHDIDASNTVNGQPICYLVNQHDYTVPSGVGYVAVVNSSNVTVRDLKLGSDYDGVLLVGTVDSFVENVNTSGNYFGIRLAFSSNNTCQYSKASNNIVGIYVDECENNNVNHNVLQSNGEGIHLYYSRGHMIDSNNLLNNGPGLYMEKSDNNTIKDNELLYNTYGVYLEKSSCTTMRNNSMTASSYNFGVEGTDLSHFVQDIDTSNTVDGKPVYYWLNQNDNEVPTEAGYVGIVNSTNISVKSMNLSNNLQGVLLAYASDCLVEDVNASNNAYGIYLHRSSNNSLTMNAVYSEGKRGIELVSSCNNTVKGSVITTNEIGIGLWLSSENNTVLGNIASIGTMGPGLYLDSSANNTISNNLLVNNHQGIYLYNSGSNTFRNNDMTGNSYNFGVYGVSLPHYVNDVDASNVADGKQVCYLVSQHDKQVPASAGYVAVVNSTGITVQDVSLSNNEQGLLFAYTTSSAITNVNVFDDYNGIYLWSSNTNIISASNVTNSGWDGIGLYYSERNAIAGNTVTNAAIGIDLFASSDNNIDTNTAVGNIVGILSYHSAGNVVISNRVTGSDRSLAGIALSQGTHNTIRRNRVAYNGFFIGAGIYLELSSSENTISQNTLSDNTYGVYALTQSNNNTIFHNNFVKNLKQALSIDSINTWDNGYPSGGNYWSDYTGVDHFRGPYQNETGSDGLGDTQYTVNGNNTDRYPFVQPYVPVLGDINQNGIVDLFDAIKEASAFGSHPGQPLWVSDADINQDGVVDIFDVIILAGNFGKTLK
jgi:parallel beta-helix repeat protein